MPAVEVICLGDGDDVQIARQQRRLIRVTRPSIWGNPFSHIPHAAKHLTRTRDEAMDRYETWIVNQPQLVDQAKRELRGKVLGCHCTRNERCHARVLAKIVNDAFPGDAKVPPPKPPPTPEDVRAAAAANSPTTMISPVPLDAVVASALLGVYDPRAYGARCDECPLKGRHTPVPPTYAVNGPGSTKLVIIGEGPGRMEIADGAPFRGPSGQMLNSMLTKAGISRLQCHVTNAAACRGDTDWEKERAAACCSARLSNEMMALPPSAPILALGAPAARVMLGKGSILKTRGLVWKLPAIDPKKIAAGERALVKRKAMGLKKYAAAIDRSEQTLWRSQARAPLAGRTCIPTIHPAYVLRGGEQLLPMLRVDVKRAVRWALEGPLRLYDEGSFEVARTADELREKLKAIRTEQILIDVETLGPEPLLDKMTMLGISEVPDGTTVGDDDVRVLLASPWKRAMGKVLNEFCKTRIVGGHNFASFDMLVLKRYGIQPERIFDSLLAHHTFASHLRQGLDHVVSMYVEASPWKVAFKAKGAEEKGGVQSRWMSSEALDVYNAGDVRTNAIAWRRLQPDLEDERLVYESDLKMAALCRSMAISGFTFDQELADELSAKLKARAGALLGLMRTVLSKPSFHPARTNDLRAALFGQLRVRPLAITATGLASTASGTLEAVKNPETRAGRLADLILRWRATEKTRKTFIVNIKPHKDGRVHPSWKAFGTVTGRFSCSRPNLMNLPRWSRKLEDRVRELYRAADGCELIYFDLSQSECRMAAHLSGDENFIQSCEKGDVHANNAKILFPDAREALERDPKGKKCARHGDEGDVKSACTCGKPFRDVAKSCVFGILYQADSETIFKFLRAQGFEVTLGDVEAMFTSIHRVYARYYEFCNENWSYCKKHGHLREFHSGRIRWLGWYPSITDTSSYPVQGGIAALMNMRLAELSARLHKGRLRKGARLVAQIHDAAIHEAEKGACADAVEAAVRQVWAKPIISPTTGREWVMPIDCKRGVRWSDFG